MFQKCLSLKVLKMMNLRNFIPDYWSHRDSLSVYKVDITNLENLPAEVRHAKSALCGIGRLKKIFRIENPQKYLQYQLKKKEMRCMSRDLQERILYHVTDVSNLDNICKTNLDFRRVTRSKFGFGVSFSSDLKYANKYSGANLNCSYERTVILCKVLYHRVAGGKENTLIPPDGKDTTIGNGKVYVKYDDCSFYPRYAFCLDKCRKVSIGFR